MGFRITDREIDRMIRKEALIKPKAQEMVRKGGVPQREAPDTTLTVPRTIIDAFLAPREGALGRQYLADLSGAERVRLSSQSNVTVYILCSESTTNGVLNPGDWVVLEDADGSPVSASKNNSDPGDDLRWFTLAPEQRMLLRLIVSTAQGTPELDIDALDGPFSVALQVDV